MAKARFTIKQWFRYRHLMNGLNNKTMVFSYSNTWNFQFTGMSFPIQTSQTNYQAQYGYVQGVNSGALASALERIYVLVNQYGHNWTYKTA